MCLKRESGGQRQTGIGIWNLLQHIFISWAAPLSCPSMLSVYMCVRARVRAHVCQPQRDRVYEMWYKPSLFMLDVLC